MAKMVVIGSANMDMVYSVERIPGAGETVCSNGVIRNPGGKGANQAVAAGRLGAIVHMIGRVGADESGDALVKSLESARVKLSGFERDAQEPTGTAFICVADNGENNIVVHPGANYKLDEAQLLRHADVLKDADICVLQMEIPHPTVWAAVELCCKYGVKVVLNPSPACDIPADVLHNVDILAPNEHEMAHLLGHAPDIEGGELSAYVRATGIGCLLMTMGADGSYCADSYKTTHYPAERVTAVDTTGAGDCFLGALCTMLSQSRPLEIAIQFATAAAALAVTRHGAQQSMPTYGEVVMRHGGI